MPTYDYKCDACGHDWELYQSMNDSPLKKCPKCKKNKAKRLLGLGAGIIFKGSGFYETDYKTKSGKEKKENSSAGESSDSSKSTENKSSNDKKDTSAKTKSSKKSQSASDKK